MTRFNKVPQVAADIAEGIQSRGGVARFNADLFYKLYPDRWYKTYPYYFEIRSGATGELKYRFFLPIPPQNMTVQDLSTSEAHATVGGVVEETAKGVFSMITLSGTTGLALNDLALSSQSEALRTVQRKDLSNLRGGGGAVANFISNAANEGLDTVFSVAEGFLGGEGTLPYARSGSAVTSANANENDSEVDSLSNSTGVNSPNSGFLARTAEEITNTFSAESPQDFKTPFSNGFAWAHALRQFFLVYQREKGLDPSLRLVFIDQKSNTQYRCVVRSAQFSRNAQKPYLITYTISMKCWGISDVDEESRVSPVDRFAEGGDLEAVNTLNITRLISAFSQSQKNLLRSQRLVTTFVRNSTSRII